MTRSITESKNAPRWLAEFDALASAPSSRSGRAARTTRSSPARRAPCADGDRGGDTQEQPQDREVVGAQTGAAQAVSQRLDRSLDRRTEPSIEHATQATRTGGTCGPLAARLAGTIDRTTDASRRRPRGRTTPTRWGSSTVKTYPTANIRNVALVGHSGSGKTTLVEALLVRAGAIPAPAAWTTARPSRTPSRRR